MAFQQIIFLLLIQGIYNADYVSSWHARLQQRPNNHWANQLYSDWLTAFSELIAHSKLVAEVEPDSLELTASEPTLLH